jgi:hypothetical protein
VYIFNPQGSTNSIFVGRRKQPLTSDLAILNPRVENPLDFIYLDLDDFEFYPHFAPKTREYEKAHNTFKILELNSRGSLRKYREKAFHNYKRVLSEYNAVYNSSTFDDIDKATQGKPAINRTLPFESEKQRILGGIKESILEDEHPTVLREMIRQKDSLPPRIKEIIETSGVATWIKL